MPIYEYECSKCGVFEHTQRMSDAALTKCPTCKRKVRRLISGSNFAFKGTGWYVTDYARKGGGKSDGGSSDGSSGKSESSSGSSSESKSTASGGSSSSGGSGAASEK